MEPHYVSMLQLPADLCLFVNQLELSCGHPGGGDDLGGELLARDPAHAPLDGAEGALPELLLELVVVGEVVLVDTALLDLYRDDHSLTRRHHRVVVSARRTLPLN